MLEAAPSHPEADNVPALDERVGHLLRQLRIPEEKFQKLLAIYNLPEGDKKKGDLDRVRFDVKDELYAANSALRNTGFFKEEPVPTVFLPMQTETELGSTSKQTEQLGEAVPSSVKEKQALSRRDFLKRAGLGSAAVAAGVAGVAAMQHPKETGTLFGSLQKRFESMTNSFPSEIERMEKELSSFPDVTVSFEGDPEKTKTLWMLAPISHMESFRALHKRKMELSTIDALTSTAVQPSSATSSSGKNRSDIITYALLTFDPENIYCTDPEDAAKMQEASMRLYGPSNLSRLKEVIPEMSPGPEKLKREQEIRDEERVQESAKEALAAVFGKEENVDAVLQRHGLFLLSSKPRFHFSEFESLSLSKNGQEPLTPGDGMKLALEHHQPSEKAERVLVLYGRDDFHSITDALNKGMQGVGGERIGAIIIRTEDHAPFLKHNTVAGK